MKSSKNRKMSATAAAPKKKKKSAKKTSLTPDTVLELEEIDCGGRLYSGAFRFRVPTISQRVDISAKKAQYLLEIPEAAVDYEGRNLADMMAYLHITIDDKDPKATPKWWTDSERGTQLYDFKPVLSLYALARAYEARFLSGDDDLGGDETQARRRPAAADSGDVDDDVQPASERPEVIATLGT